MPFTLSHPAAIALLWPLARRARLPLAALAIGAMSPDFEFFLHLRPLALWSHTATGLIGFCLPAGLAVFAAWDLVARGPLRDLLGYSAEPPQQARGWDTWIRAAIAVLVGAATHLLWDGLTHGDYWGARIWPGLRTTALTVGTLSVPWFNLLQHLSTLVGGLVVIGWGVADVRVHGDVRVVLRSGWRRRAIVVIALAAVCAGLMNCARGPFSADFWTLQRLLGRIAVGGMLGGAVAVLGVALRYRTRSESPRGVANGDVTRGAR